MHHRFWHWAQLSLIHAPAVFTVGKHCGQYDVLLAETSGDVMALQGVIASRKDNHTSHVITWPSNSKHDIRTLRCKCPANSNSYIRARSLETCHALSTPLLSLLLLDPLPYNDFTVTTARLKLFIVIWESQGHPLNIHRPCSFSKPLHPSAIAPATFVTPTN